VRINIAPLRGWNGMEWKRRKSKEVEEDRGTIIADPPRTMESRMLMRGQTDIERESSIRSKF